MINKRTFVFLIIMIISTTFAQNIHVQAHSVKDCFDPTNDTQCDDLPKGELEDSDEQPNDEHKETDLKDDDNTTGIENEGKPSTSLFFTFIKMIFALVLVIALIYVTIKFLSKRNKLFNQNDILENLGGISIGTNKSVQIIRIGDKLYVIGVGDNVELLQEIDDEQLIEQFLAAKEKADATPSFLQSFIQRQQGKDTSTKATDETDRKDHSFTNVLKSELNKLKLNRKQLMNRRIDKDDEDV